MKNILFYFGHPAQYLFAKASINGIKKNNNVIIVLKTKDVLENLVKSDGHEYINILPDQRGKSKLSIILSLIKRIFKILPIVAKHKPDVMISTDASFAIVGFLLKKNVITITEDDYDVIKSLGDLTYPFTSSILCPVPCSVGKWDHKKTGYLGYMKLAYLHPNIFKLDNHILKKYGFTERYALIRIAKLTAHHDFGIKGIESALLVKIIDKLKENDFKVLISSEGELPSQFSEYKLSINPQDIHHVLAGSSFFICDSQSMSVEAAMLGIPSIRYSSFAGRISVLEELEEKYHLTFGISAGNETNLLNKMDFLLNMDNINEVFQNRRKIMLQEKINVAEFLAWFIVNFPESKNIMKLNPDYQLNFK